MSLRPFYRRYPSDFVAGVSGMPAEYIGIYSVLLDLMYARWKKLECRTAKDRQGLARACGSTTRRFNQVLADLIAMPKKITQDAQGRLSNTRFERELAKLKGDEDSSAVDDPEGKKRTKGGELSPIYPEINSRKIRDNVGDKVAPKSTRIQQKQPLNPKKPPPRVTRARACLPYSIFHIHTPETFAQWHHACIKTIPRGHKKALALRRWCKLPTTIALADLIDAWQLYIEDNREKSKGMKFPIRTLYPENWLRDRVYENYLDQLAEHRERERNTKAALQKRAEMLNTTITQWNGKAQALISRIGNNKFASIFAGVTLKLTDSGAELDFHQNDFACSEAERCCDNHLADILGKVRYLSDRRRASAERFHALQAQRDHQPARRSKS
jgi:uncharacterized protein YdaU (DUF1376 family)